MQIPPQQGASSADGRTHLQLRKAPANMWNKLQFRCLRMTLTHQYFFLWRYDPTRVMASSFLMFLDHTQRRTTVGRTPLDEWSARRRDLYLTTQNTHNRQISMPSVGFEPTISARERSQTCALDRAATGTGNFLAIPFLNTISIITVQQNTPGLNGKQHQDTHCPLNHDNVHAVITWF